MLIYVKDPDYTIITAVEGTGDNLTDEDIKDGYIDYFMTSIYKQEGEEIELADGGQLLTITPIKDMEQEEQVKRLLDYWGLSGDYVVLDN